MNKNQSIINGIPVIPVRDRVVFPNVVVPLVMGRPRSVQAVKTAMSSDRLAFVVHQRHVKVENPKREDLFEFGTLVEIIEVVNLPDGLMRIRVSGQRRAKLLDLAVVDSYLKGDVQVVESPSLGDSDSVNLEAVRRVVIKRFEEYGQKMGRISSETVQKITQNSSLEKMADAISDALLISVEEKQDLIEKPDLVDRLDRIIEILNAEVEILNLERKIQNRVDRQVQKTHREYYLNEQMRAIQKELKKTDDHSQEMEDFRSKIKDLHLEKEVEEMALKEVDRLQKMMPFSPESTVVRSYLEWIVNLPWNTRTEDKLDVAGAKKMLDDDHYGLEKPKERLLEYLAVLKLTKSLRGPILCFVGPPGTGKTSLAKSLARALDRKFVRISLGGVRDEAEIRGHRRTYIGSLPGKIMKGLRRVASKNPVILLDEIDKMGTDFRGDPAAALLEVLDPEQNKSFVDHYMDIGFDLSEVIFIATANSLYGVPTTLLDRLEVIRYSAYTTDEKVFIANKYLLPKVLKEHGLQSTSLQISEDAVRKIIHLYTHEAGVRGLQRKLAQVCRKVAVEIVNSKPKKGSRTKKIKIGLNELPTYLGAPEYQREKTMANSIGVSTGLAWTEVGGETLTIEVTTVPGQGKLLLTGKLGDVMQESAQAAWSYVRSRLLDFNIDEEALRKKDLHIHVPEGATPKDGPSAGIALASAILSRVTGQTVKPGIAMTGEVTLTGRVLPIGGLKEKVLAAHRENIGMVLFPEGNKKDLPEIPENVKKSIQLVSVKHMDQVINLALDIPSFKPALGPKDAALFPQAN